MRSRGRHRPFGFGGTYSATITSGTVVTIADYCDGTATNVLEGEARVIPKLTRPLGGSRNLRATAPASSPEVSAEMVSSGESLLVSCFDPEQPFTGRTCLKAHVAPPEFDASISTEVYEGTYDLCITPPGDLEKCHAYGFGPRGIIPIVFFGRQIDVSGKPLRASRVDCFMSGRGDYQVRWIVGGQQFLRSLFFTAATPASPDTAGRGTCPTEAALLAGTQAFAPPVATSPAFSYGPLGGAAKALQLMSPLSQIRVP